MTVSEELIREISGFYTCSYGSVERLKKKYINEYMYYSEEKKSELLERCNVYLDWANMMIEYCKIFNVDSNDCRLELIDKYRQYFKSLSILLNNSIYKSDFINPFTNEKATPREIVEAKMFIFDTTSPKETTEVINKNHLGKKRDSSKNGNESWEEVSSVSMFNDIDEFLDKTRKEIDDLNEYLEISTRQAELLEKIVTLTAPILISNLHCE